MDRLEIYASVVLHKGCALTGERHRWKTCPHKQFYLRIARKHSHWLKSNGLYIGPLCKQH